MPPGVALVAQARAAVIARSAAVHVSSVSEAHTTSCWTSAYTSARTALAARLIHVLEYIWKAAWCLHPAGDAAAEDWVAVKALAVLAGDSARAAAEITAEADAAGLKGSLRAGADACVRYLTGKDEFLRYEQALAAGWPIATGVIEGACRHIIGDRLCITGARWGLAGSEAVLTLRAVISNGDFDDYWRFHLAREHQRLYPAQPKASTHSAPDLPLCSILPYQPAGNAGARPLAPARSSRT